MKKLTKIICTVLSCMLMLSSTLFLGACAPETPPILSTATCTVKTGENRVDFVMDFALDRDVKVLQITDTQLQNWYGARTPQRHEEVMGIFANGMAKDHEIRAWRYVREAFDKVKPDLILVERNESFNGILTTKLLAEARGILEGACAGATIKQYSVSEIRKGIDLVGLTRNFVNKLADLGQPFPKDITKSALKLYIEEKYSISTANTDESDACMVFDCYLREMGASQ